MATGNQCFQTTEPDFSFIFVLAYLVENNQAMKLCYIKFIGTVHKINNIRTSKATGLLQQKSPKGEE